jgi:hypothetical protein
MHSALRTLEVMVGKPCEALLRGEPRDAIVFDWEKIPAKAQEAFLEEIFGDWEGEVPAFSSLVSRVPRGKSQKVAWTAEDRVPFALLNVDTRDGVKGFRGGKNYPQFEHLLVAEVAKRGTPIASLEVDGTAVPVKKLAAIASALDRLGLRLKARDQEKTKKKSTRDIETAQALEKAVESFSGRLSDYRLGRHGYSYPPNLGCRPLPPNKAKAEKALPQCEKLLAKIGELIAQSELIANELGAGGLPADYRGLLDRVTEKQIEDGRWKSAYNGRLNRDQQFFRSLHATLFHEAAGTPGWPTGPLQSYAQHSKAKK